MGKRSIQITLTLIRTNLMNEFMKAAGILQGIKDANRVNVRKCEWENPVDVAAWRSSVGLKDRIRILDSVVPNRVCGCGRMVLSPRSWVIKKDGSGAQCRSCYYSCEEWIDAGVNVEVLDTSIIGDLVPRYEIKGAVICEVRRRCGVSCVKFAERCGWGTSYQRKLECGKFKTVSADTAEILLRVFAEIGVVFAVDSLAIIGGGDSGA